jgi:RNA polymerase subunit RPABC4/transcription elongation factor Spt4
VVEPSQSVLELIAVAVVLIAFVGGLFYVANRRLKARLAELRGGGEGSSEFTDDRSYNLIRIARAEAETLKRQGVDVHVAETAIADADDAMRHRNYDMAVLDARRAHEVLVGLRARPVPLPGTSASAPPPLSRSMTPPTPTPNATVPSNEPPPSPEGVPGTDAPPVPRLAKNRAESRFQISLLNEEIAAASPSRANDPALLEASSATKDAQAAYDRADYTEAMRLALRGRRKLGTRIETLPPPTTRIPPTPPALAPVALGGPAGMAPCVQCGRPLKAADKFCRACGTPKSPSACAMCGTAVEPEDRFCPACGATVA